MPIRTRAPKFHTRINHVVRIDFRDSFLFLSLGLLSEPPFCWSRHRNYHAYHALVVVFVARLLADVEGRMGCGSVYCWCAACTHSENRLFNQVEIAAIRRMLYGVKIKKNSIYTTRNIHKTTVVGNDL